MRRALSIAAAVMVSAMAFIASMAAAAEPIAVIVNRENPVEALTEHDIRKIYTNHTLNWPGGAMVTIYDLAMQSPLRAIFSDRILGSTPEKVAEEWAHLKITNQAKNPPITMKSEMLIIRKVASEKGAIGYVSMGLVTNNPAVKIVYLFR